MVQYVQNLTFNKLRNDVADVLKKHANPATVHTLHHAREAETGQRECEAMRTSEPLPTSPPFDPLTAPLNVGNMVFENASLFLCDALILHEFTDAIKGGYSEHIIRVLKALTLLYRGSGQTKYAHELLHLLHNLTHVWPPGFQ